MWALVYVDDMDMPQSDRKASIDGICDWDAWDIQHRDGRNKFRESDTGILPEDLQEPKLQRQIKLKTYTDEFSNYRRRSSSLLTLRS